jgi:hypothetical protein
MGGPSTENKMSEVATVTAENIGEKSIEELLAFYNVNSKRKLKKFADLPTAVAKVTTLLETLAAEAVAVAARIEAGITNPRSAGVSESWKNPEVAAKRKERSRVEVNGVVYKSVADAFRHLGIDMKHHIKFRQELKANGTDEEWGYVWKILPGDAIVTAPKLGVPATPAEPAAPADDTGTGDETGTGDDAGADQTDLVEA